MISALCNTVKQYVNERGCVISPIDSRQRRAEGPKAPSPGQRPG